MQVVTVLSARDMILLTMLSAGLCSPEIVICQIDQVLDSAICKFLSDIQYVSPDSVICQTYVFPVSVICQIYVFSDSFICQEYTALDSVI
jgi:hypothetical protein